jgi:tRNA A37 threonylcarbamoyladenosine synthetase subunit TsaC/SUA5/YrdC
LYVDGGPAGRDVPSTVVDVSGRRPRIVREGAVPADAVHQAISGA